MSVRLLWHSHYLDGPLIGLCILDEEKLLFNRITEEYKNGKIKLFRLSEDDLANVEEQHEGNRKIIGHINDYGRSFLDIRKGAVCVTTTVSYVYPRNAEYVKTIDYSDIINPYQNM